MKTLSVKLICSPKTILVILHCKVSMLHEWGCYWAQLLRWDWFVWFNQGKTISLDAVIGLEVILPNEYQCERNSGMLLTCIAWGCTRDRKKVVLVAAKSHLGVMRKAGKKMSLDPRGGLRVVEEGIRRCPLHNPLGTIKHFWILKLCEQKNYRYCVSCFGLAFCNLQLKISLGL